MTNKFTLHETVIGILVGDIKEGDKFTTSSGFNAVFKDGKLSWVSQNGYVLSPVSVSTENLKEDFFLQGSSRVEISFADALDFLAMGDKVIVDVEGKGREYEVTSLSGLDEVIEKEYFADLYHSQWYVEATDEEMKVVAEVMKEVELPFTDLEEDTVSVGKKITEAEAYNIHHLYHFAKFSVAQIADKYGISTRMVYYILDGQRWEEAYNEFHIDYDIVKDDYVK